LTVLSFIALLCTNFYKGKRYHLEYLTLINLIGQLDASHEDKKGGS